MTKCENCNNLAEALHATMRLVYYLLQPNLSQAERDSVKQQFEAFITEMDGNHQQSSDDNPHIHTEPQ